VINLEPGKRYSFLTEVSYVHYSSADWYKNEIDLTKPWKKLKVGEVVLLVEVVDTYIDDTDLRVLTPSGELRWIWLSMLKRNCEMIEVI
jgi:hypothetical protein